MSSGASPVAQSVMARHGFYSEHSQPQHAAAEVAYPMLHDAANTVPLPSGGPACIGDFGCAGGRNEMQPLTIAVRSLRSRDASVEIAVAHTDLPQNDFAPLFEVVASADSYTVGIDGVYPLVIGRTLYGPLLPSATLLLGWSGITLHWLSEMPCVVDDQVFSNLVVGPHRAELQERARDDWERFLEERARELVDGGELVLIAGASNDAGAAGAEGLFTMVQSQLDAMTDAGQLRAAERARIFYPTWNRTPAEWLEPFSHPPCADLFEIVDQHADTSDDARSYPEWADGGDAAGFAHHYIDFVRAVTDVPLFRSLDEDRTQDERDSIRTTFYQGLEGRIRDDPAAATCTWHTFSLRLRRRPR